MASSKDSSSGSMRIPAMSANCLAVRSSEFVVSVALLFVFEYRMGIDVSATSADLEWPCFIKMLFNFFGVGTVYRLRSAFSANFFLRASRL